MFCSVARREQRTPVVAGPRAAPMKDESVTIGRRARPPRKGASGILVSSVTDLTGYPRRAKVEGLPRNRPKRHYFGARPLLENSTACQKSMPKPRPWGRRLGPDGPVGHPMAIPLVEMDGLITRHLLSQDHGPSGPLQMSVPLGVPRQTSTESLILAQDERWRRA